VWERIRSHRDRLGGSPLLWILRWLPDAQVLSSSDLATLIQTSSHLEGSHGSATPTSQVAYAIRGMTRVKTADWHSSAGRKTRHKLPSKTVTNKFVIDFMSLGIYCLFFSANPAT